MAGNNTEQNNETLRLFQLRNRLLTTTREYSLTSPDTQSTVFIFKHCCKILGEAFRCEAWAGDLSQENGTILLPSTNHSTPPSASVQRAVKNLLDQQFGKLFNKFLDPITLKLEEETEEKEIHPKKLLLWPVVYRDCNFGFICLHCNKAFGPKSLQIEYLICVAFFVVFPIYFKYIEKQKPVVKTKISSNH